MPTDYLKGIDVNALEREYGDKKAMLDALKGIDINALSQEYGQNPEPPIQPKQPQEYWQGLANDPSWSALGQRLGVGILRGGKDVLDTGANALARGTSYVADKVLPEELAKPIRDSAQSTIAENKAARDKYDQEYGDITSANIGRIGGQIAATLPIMPMRAMQGIAAASKALPTISATGAKIAAPFLNRATSAAGQGALGGAVIGAATSSANDKSLAENIGEGGITGAITGPLLTGAASLAKGTGSKIVGRISASRADLAKRADDLGISLKATQVSDSPLLKKYDQMSGLLPFSGAQGITSTQLNQFTRAISRTFGKNVDEITPEIVAKARKDIGKGMENIYLASNVKADNQLALDLKKVFDDAAATHADTEMKPVFNNIMNVVRKISPTGEIDGSTFHALTKYDAVLSKAQQSSNPNIANSANQIRNALDKALERSLAPNELTALRKLKLQYKSAMTVKDLVDASADGHVSPLKLMAKVTKAPGGKLGSGELGEIADIGRAFFPTPADSGTPLGEKILHMLHSPLTAGAAGYGAFSSGVASVADLGLSAAGLIVNRLARKGVNSEAAKNAMIRSAKGETHGIINQASEAVIPYTLPIVRRKDDEPLRITVTK